MQRYALGLNWDSAEIKLDEALEAKFDTNLSSVDSLAYLISTQHILTQSAFEMTHCMIYTAAYAVGPLWSIYNQAFKRR